MPVAHGGEATTANLRLRCRTHNQYEAERTFGAGFMQRKRERAKRCSAGAAREAKPPHVAAPAAAADGPCDTSRAREASDMAKRAVDEAAAAERARQEVIPWLRARGVRPADARRAAASSGAPPDAPLEERVRLALRLLVPASARRVMPGMNGAA